LALPGRPPCRFRFEDTPRSDAQDTLARLSAIGLPVELLSGDRELAVAAAARAAGLSDWHARLTPQGKIARLDELSRAGHKVLMVGDGLNDAPALAAAHASMSPTSAAEISQTAADAVFQGDRLGPVAEVIAVARATHRVVVQNFALAFGYNALFVPLAVAGFVTPLLAAVAMSTSSIAVTLNAARLRR
jgi:Cu2+-exporting ATPase